jgi:hypothetical protein
VLIFESMIIQNTITVNGREIHTLELDGKIVSYDGSPRAKQYALNSLYQAVKPIDETRKQD